MILFRQILITVMSCFVVSCYSSDVLYELGPQDGFVEEVSAGEENSPLSALDVAKHFGALYLESTAGDAELDTLKIQKLLYYAQGYYLAINGELLFKEPIEASDCGPVVPEVRSELEQATDGKDYSLPIDFAKRILLGKNSFDRPKIVEHLLVIYAMFSNYTGVDLIHKTRDELPWKVTKPSSSKLIDNDLMKDFFRKTTNVLSYFKYSLVRNQNKPEQLMRIVQEVRNYVSFSASGKRDLDQIYDFFVETNQSTPDLIIAIFQTCSADLYWGHQGILGSVLSYIFFPLQFEFLYEDSTSLYSRELLRHCLALSARHGHPLAHAHLNRILDFYQVNDSEKRSNNSKQDWKHLPSNARELVQRYLDESLVEETEKPTLYMGLLHHTFGSKEQAEKYFKKGFEEGSGLCAFRYARMCVFRYALMNDTEDILENKQLINCLNEYNTGYLAFLKAQFLQTEPHVKIWLLCDAGKKGMPEGYYNAGLLCEKHDKDQALQLYLAASRARQPILDGYDNAIAIEKDRGNFKDARQLCREKINAGASDGHILLGQVFQMQGNNECAIKSYEQAGVDGFSLLKEIHSNSEELKNNYRRDVNTLYHSIREDAGYEIP